MIGFLFRYLPIVISLAGILTGFGINWWFDITDWQTAAIFAAALVACVYISGSSSPFARLGVVIILVIAGYLKGGVDKEHELVPEFEKKVVAIHAAYKAQSDAETRRQQQANDAALQQAEADKAAYDSENQKLRAENEKLTAAAAQDKFALRPGLSVDAVDRLNKRRLRGSPGS
jgi:hypothetical protein